MLDQVQFLKDKDTAIPAETNINLWHARSLIDRRLDEPLDKNGRMGSKPSSKTTLATGSA